MKLPGLMISAFFTLLAGFLLVPATHGQHENMGEMKPAAVTLELGLGQIHHKVTTKSPLAQKYFDQGLAYIYAFNHEEAVKAFKHAAQIDPDLAMAYWGAALALGSNYNLEADSAALKEAYANLAKAQATAAITSLLMPANLEDRPRFSHRVFRR